MSAAEDRPRANRRCSRSARSASASRASSRTSRSRRSATSRTRGCSRRGGRAGGYRLFSEDDVERLQRILELQRDEFLPLRVIRQELAAPSAKDEAQARGRRSPSARTSSTSTSSASGPASTRDLARELEEFGLLAPRTEARRSATPRPTPTSRSRAGASRGYGISAAAPADLPHRRRPRGEPARGRRRAGAPRSERRARDRRGSASSRRSPRPRRSSSQLLFWRDLREFAAR